MTADVLLGRLPRVRKTGVSSWLASCPGPLHQHGDRHPSLAVRETDDGRLLLKCFAGCSVPEIVGALGLELHDLFPPRPIEHGKRARRPFFPADVFEIARLEVGVAAIISCDMHNNRAIDEAGYERLLAACGRLHDIAEAAYGH